MTWSTAGEDIYYQGKTDKELPIGVNFTYYLDGEKIEPKDLAGKSGKLTIDIEYENNTETTMTVDGKDQTTKVPFVMMTAMFMPSEKFSNITIDNGKIIDDGSKSIVVGFGMPGLSDVLDVDRLKSDDGSDSLDIYNITNKVDNTSIPESVEIKADVTDFSLDSTYTIATNDIFNEIDFSDVSSLSDLTDKVDEIEDATLQLVDGSKELADGTKTLKENYVTMDKGIYDLQTGIKSYTDGVLTATNGSYDISIGATSLRDGLGTISSNSASLKKGASDAADGVKAYVGGVETMKAGINTKQAVLSNSSPVDVATAFLNTNDAYKKLSTYSGLLQQTDKTAQVLKDIQTAMAQAQAGQGGQQGGGGNAKANDFSFDTDSDDGRIEVNNATETDENSNIENVDEDSKNSVSADISYADAPDTVVETATEDDAEATQNDENNDVSDIDANSDVKSETLSVQNFGPVLMDNNAGQANAGDANAQQAQMIAKIVATDYGLTDQTTITAMTQIIGAGLTAYQQAASQGQDKAMAAFSTAATQAVYSQSGLTADTASATIQEAAMAQALVQLNSGLNTLTANDSALISGADTLSTGISQYTDGVDTAYAGSKTLADGAASLYNGMLTITANNDSLNNGATELKAGSVKVMDGINKLYNGASKLSKGTKQYYDEVITKGIKPLAKSLDKLSDMTEGDYSYKNFSGISDDMDGTVRFVITTESIKADDSE